ncbi:MAG: TRAP transporter small permease [Syntrophomonadaceae bacterium]|jgi:TRAP-type C4-dicarboxylate transport system permease small subunit
MKIIKRINELLNGILFKIADFVVFIASVCLVFSISIQVFARYVLNKSPRWTTEFACFSLVFLVFWGSSIALKKGLHIEIDTTKYKLPKRVLNVFRIISSISIYFFCIIIIYYGALITINNSQSLSEAMKIPYSYIYINVPICGFLMLIGYTDKLLNSISK